VGTALYPILVEGVPFVWSTLKKIIVMTDEGFLKYLDEEFLDKTYFKLQIAITTYYKELRVNKSKIDSIIGLIRSTGKYIVEEGRFSGGFTIRKNPDYKTPTERDKEISELTFKKLDLDVKNAERIYDSYWWTFGFALAALVISIFLLVLKLLELSKQ